MGRLFGVRERLSPRADLLIGLGAIGLVIALWCFVTLTGRVKPIFLPTPGGIWEGLMSFQSKGWLLSAVVRSTVRVAQALLITAAVGVPLGLLMGAFPAIDAALRKIVNGGKSIPTTGVVGLIVLWFSIEERAKIVFLFLGAIFYMIVLVKNAVSEVSDEYVLVAKDIGASSIQLLRMVLFPGALPGIWDAIGVCNGIMWTYIILAEFINSNEEQLGLGYLLQVASRTNNSGQVFGILIIIAIISSLTDWVFQLVRKRYFPW
jgi:ABC-type nitrate/sulfonate/bicarbonate transport system permease component